MSFCQKYFVSTSNTDVASHINEVTNIKHILLLGENYVCDRKHTFSAGVILLDSFIIPK